MVKVDFRYKDELSNWEWRNQSCTVTDVNKCIEFYGLDKPDVEYEILKVTPTESK